MQQSENRQVFTTHDARRWKKAKWGFRLLLLLIIVAIASIAVAINNLFTPSLPKLGQEVKKSLSANNFITKESKLAKKYKGFRSYINDKNINNKRCGTNSIDTNAKLFNPAIGIRAAFFVEWDPQSFFSLKRNISKINLVIPEWFFLDSVSCRLITKVDERSDSLMKQHGVKIMPMLTNNVKGMWRGDLLHKILSSEKNKALLIGDIKNALLKHRFSGINIDFEDLQEKTNEPLAAFQKQLYDTLHKYQLLVSQNVSPFNEDYDYQTLSKYNDYVFLMAYDEHSENTGPGNICSQKWVEAAVMDAAKKIAPQKLILNLAAYGYDWSKDTVATLTYQQAIQLAASSGEKIHFDNDSYNLSFSYYDDKDALHHVFFTDAVTSFNSVRFSTEFGLAGTALWRLGAEDNRLWDFYPLPMDKQSLKKFNFKEFDKVEGINDVDYIGEGEILDVVATPKSGHITTELDTADMLIAEESYDELPSKFVVRKWGKTGKPKMVLTFDDGPDPLYTRQILDTLAKYHVPASFFIVGIEAEKNIPLVKRIFREGHELGNHTFTHPNVANISTKRALLEMDATNLLIECITGHSTILFRAPFNADYEPEKMEELTPLALSRKRNYLTVGESIDPNDWEKSIHPTLNADSIFQRTVNIYLHHLQNGDSTNIILLHDAGGDRSETVKALPLIIKYFKNRGYSFTTVTDLLGKKRADVMPAVPKGSGYYLLAVSYLLAEIGYYIGNIFFVLFITFLLLGVLRLSVILFFTYLQKKKMQLPVHNESENSFPFVSIIVPAYNEEVNIVSSINNLLKCDYPFFEIIFIDDGSKDKTYEKVVEAFKHNDKVKIFAKFNGGKASALNFGIAQSGADYVVCIDADTQLKSDAVSKLMLHLIGNTNVGAVAGNVKVGNEVNMLTRWQSLEYITSQNFDRSAFAYLNAITVVPGAIGGFRKDAIISAGGFTTDTLAEDCDLTIRIINAGYIVANEPAAIALTEAPETLKQFLKQRFRWTFGVMQTFWKHKDLLLSTKVKGLGWFALPDILLFKYTIPFFAPIADVLMFIGIVTGNAEKIILYYLLFMLVDALIAVIALILDPSIKEVSKKLNLLFWLIPQRFVYRWLMLYIFFKSLRKAIKGELQHWGVLKRTGNVKEAAVI